MGFGDQLKKARDKNGMTQDGLAELLDVSRQTVSEWECGNTFPKFEKLAMLPNILDVSIEILMVEEIAKMGNADTQEELMPGAVAGLEAFAAGLSNVKEQLKCKENLS